MHSGQIHRYRHRVSCPLLDRIDIHIEVPAVPYKELSTEYSGEKSASIRERVIKARDAQLERFKSDKVYSNGQMKTRHIKNTASLNLTPSLCLTMRCRSSDFRQEHIRGHSNCPEQSLIWIHQRAYNPITSQRRFNTERWTGGSFEASLTTYFHKWFRRNELRLNGRDSLYRITVSYSIRAWSLNGISGPAAIERPVLHLLMSFNHIGNYRSEVKPPPPSQPFIIQSILK